MASISLGSQGEPLSIYCPCFETGVVMDMLGTYGVGPTGGFLGTTQPCKDGAHRQQAWWIYCYVTEESRDEIRNFLDDRFKGPWYDYNASFPKEKQEEK